MLSQTIEYALRAMVCLAAADPEASLNSETIAERTRVPRGYLSKILRDLVVARLILSQRGPSGGFVLASDPSRISVLDVVNAVDPMNRIRECPLGNPAHLHLCPLHRRLDDALGLIEREFERTSLQEIVDSGAKPGQRCRSLTSPTIKGKQRRRSAEPAS